MKKYKQISFIALGLMLSVTSFAQDDWENNTGEIEDVEVQIIKDREITLLKANRNFEKITPTFSATQVPRFEYKFQSFVFEVPDLTFRLRPLRIKNEKLQKLYGGYFKAGFGNFGTPYLEGYINNKRDQQYAYGVHVKHLSSKNGPIDDENSGASESQIDVFGKIFTKKAVLGGSLGYEQNKVHFYGYPTGTISEAADIEQQFNKIKVDGFVKSNSKQGDVSYYLGAGYSHISDDFSAKEEIFTTKFDLAYPINEDKIKLATDIKVINRTDMTLSDSRYLVAIRPTYQFTYSDFKLEAGLNATYENDTLQDLGKLHLYPVMKAAYDISDQIKLYAGLDGGIVANTYQSVVERVPFLMTDVPIYHTNRLYQISGGVRAKAGKSSYLHTGFTMSGYKYYQYFLNDPSDISRFTIAYDTKTSTVANLFGEWELSKSNKFQLSMRGDYFIYNMGSQPEAWHQPQYKITVLSKYNIYDKIILGANLHVNGGIKALDSVGNAVSLDTAVDLGVNASYLVSDRFSLFVNLDNILSQEYELLNNYPVKGLQIMAGLNYTF